jgi:alpha-L-fucosidase 2
MKNVLLALVLLTLLDRPATAQQHDAGAAAPQSAMARLDSYDLSWDRPGPNSQASMPIGNGDIGLNVWVDPGGDLLFYISKTDAWGGEKDPRADSWMQQGGVLMKLGLVRISLSPNPLTGAGTNTPAPANASLAGGAGLFRQTLHLRDGEITVTEGVGAGAVNYRIWVDANHPIIRVEVSGSHPLKTTVTLHDWRLENGDTIVAAHGPRVPASQRPSAATSDRITWFHHNPSAGDPRLADPHLVDITFGATIEGGGLGRDDDSTLSSREAGNVQLISIHPLTATVRTSTVYLAALSRQTKADQQLVLETTREAHQRWWRQFWDRSHIFLSGNEQGDAREKAVADSVTRGYILQRFVTACAGRGAAPIKFNGSIFVVDNPDWKVDGHPAPMNADFRAWGGQYWFQNTRPMYWPRLAAGDLDLMLPLFEMYRRMLPGNSAAVRQYYGHGGAYFQETTPWWGGLPFMGPNEEALYTHHYFTPILELSMMMLDYYEYTGDDAFARKYLLPIASAGLEFFERHFPRDSAGGLLLDPDNSIEMYWKVHDPAPDIAGLKAVLTRMLQLPLSLHTPQREQWRELLAVLPPLPIDTVSGAPSLLPYTGPQTAKSHNFENPELYAIYPYRLYGMGKPGFELARHSFAIRKCPQKGCWSQDPIEAAMLGFTDIAKEDTRYALTRKDPDLKFPAFWTKGNDYLPDEDNGGNGENGLQQMLLQTDGAKIFLLPAWPADWDADFKLHAPYHTVVEGRVRKGHLVGLKVTPEIRRRNVIDCSQTPPAQH